MSTLNNFVYVQKSGITAPASATGSQIFNPRGTDYIQDGQIVVTDTNGHVYNAGSYNSSTNPYGLNSHPNPPKKFNIRCRQGDTVYHSADIPVDKVETYLGLAYRPALEQLTYIGYNGTNGTLTSVLEPDVTYKLTLWREDNDAYQAVDRPESALWKAPSTFGSTGTAATDQRDLGIELLDQLYKIFTKGVTGYRVFQPALKFELITDNAGTGSVTAAVYNESEYIVVTSASGLTLNQVIKVGNGLYKIVGISGTTIKLHIPYQGDDASAAAIKTFTFADSFKYGIKITGKVLTPEPSLWPYRKVLFKVSYNEYINGDIRDYGITSVAFETKGVTTTTTNVVAANTAISDIKAYRGVGTAGEVRWLEWDYMGAWSNEKGYLLSVDRERYRSFVSDLNGKTCTYSLLTLGWKNPFTNNPTANVNDSGSIMIAIPVSYNTSSAAITETVATATTYGFIPTLDKLLTSYKAAQTSAITTY